MKISPSDTFIVMPIRRSFPDCWHPPRKIKTDRGSLKFQVSQQTIRVQCPAKAPCYRGGACYWSNSPNTLNSDRPVCQCQRVYRARVFVPYRQLPCFHRSRFVLRFSNTLSGHYLNCRSQIGSTLRRRRCRSSQQEELPALQGSRFSHDLGYPSRLFNLQSAICNLQCLR